MIRIAVVEDEEKEIDCLKIGIKTYFDKTCDEYDLRVFRDGMEFLDAYRGNFDLVLMDIEMPVLNGYKTAQKIREKDPDVAIVFVTNLAQYAVKGYEVDAVGFIVKPITYYALSVNLGRAVAKIKCKTRETVQISTRDGVRIVTPDSIAYVEVILHTVVYHTDQGDITVRGALKDVEQKLDGFGFSRCNVCYLVNLKHVQTVKGDTVYLPGAELTLTRGRKKEFLNDLMKYLNK